MHACMGIHIPMHTCACMCVHMYACMCAHVCAGFKEESRLQRALSDVTKRTVSDSFPQREMVAKRTKVVKSKFMFSPRMPWLL